MDENPIQVSAERTLEILQRILLIGSMTEEFCNDKKMLSSLSRTLKQESKKLARSKYPFLGNDTDKLHYLLTQLREVVHRFKKAKKAEHYRMASTGLSEFFGRIEQVIVDTAACLAEKSEFRKRMQENLKKADAFTRQLESKSEGGSEPPKKAIRDRDSE